MTTDQLDEQDELKRVNAEIQRIVQHQEAGRLDQAATLIDALLSQYENEPRIWHLKGLNLIQQGKTEEGKATLENVLSHTRKDPQVLVDYASLLAQNGDLQQAIDTFREAVEVAPNFGIAHGNLGRHPSEANLRTF